MTTLSIPSGITAQHSQFGLESNTEIFTSIFTKSSQTVEWPGARWRLTMTLPPMKLEDARVWKVFLVKLRGQAGRFYGYDPDYNIVGPAGTALGAGLINGGGQVGTSLVTDGWTAGQAKLFAQGDMIAFDTAFGRELKMVTADVASDGGGNAVIPIEPPVRNAPANNTAIIVNQPSCIMQLDDPAVMWDSDQRMRHGFSFSATEAF